MAHILLSAAHKSSGKTTISIGLCAAFNARGLQVHPFKKGPDYIDPMWLSRAAGHPCHTLDFYTSTHAEILHTVAQHHHQSDLSLIEGNKGLYDGLDLKGSNSNAALAKFLHAPVILVLDARGMTRGIAPLVLGYQHFDAEVNIAGVILNQVGGSRHEGKLRRIMEHYTDVPVLGAVQRDPALDLEERHLGLMPSNEDHLATEKISAIGNAIATQVDLDQLLSIAQDAELPAIAPPSVSASIGLKTEKKLRIGIAQDAAFGFYYPSDLQALQDAGAELISINTLKDTQLPKIDGLFIGGGFPETQMKALEANTQLRFEIHQAIENGLPCYAECGGLMYLSNAIHWQGQRCEMVGIIPAETEMHPRPQGRGYVRLQENSDSLWPRAGSAEIAAHEFHYSALSGLEHNPAFKFAYQVKRGVGINGQHDGLIYKNLMACYSHQRNSQQNPWTRRFIDFVHRCQTPK
ncbi:MAG: cobyrinate a,c-diamide synthase [Gammaproteobacteria bacterium]|nr:cobyrinate a,c-diamide synthase [Gammaproteobacteria bacterium]